MKKNNTIIFILILSFFAVLLTYQINLPAADDMARHIVNGREILHGNFDVLYKNVYSYTMPDQPFVNHHWLSGVIFYLLFIVIGWKGLVVFKVLIFLLTFSILFVTARKKADFWLVAFFSVPTILILMERSSLRPEIFSYLFIALFLYILFDFDDNPNSKKIWWLIPLQIFWVNMHLFFIIGPALVGGFLFEKIILDWKNFWRNSAVKKLSSLFFGLMLAMLINPQGFAGAMYPFRIFDDYGFNVTENNPLVFFLRTYPSWSNISMSIFTPSVILLALSFTLAFWQKRKPIFLFLASVTTAVGGYVIARLLGAFSIIFFLSITANLEIYYLRAKNYLSKIKIKIIKANYLLGGMLLILILTIVFSGKVSAEKNFGLGLTEGAENPGDFFVQNGLHGPVFNDYDIGSYLIYYLYPREQVFVDNRPEAYSKKFWEETYTPLIENEDYWRKNSEKFGFNSIFFYRYDSGPKVADFFYRRLSDPDWKLVYAGKSAVIFVRNNEANKEIIRKWEITRDNVEARMTYLLQSNNYEDMVAAADNYNLVGRTDLGRAIFWKVVTRWPDNGKIWKVMADWQLNDNSLQSSLLSIMYLKRAIATGYNTADTHGLLAATYIRIGYWAEAREEIDAALKANPQYQDAKELTNILEQRSK